jgi:DNA polymerase (family 10)
MAKTQGKISLEAAELIAKAIVAKLKPYCKRIEVAGSVRRQRPRVNDIDLVLIPLDIWNLHHELMGLGQMRMSGTKILRVISPSPYGPLQVDIYIATPETWGTLLLIRTGSTEHNIRLCARAKQRGWHLAANGDGLFNEEGKRIAGDDEASIFRALGLAYREPPERE